MSNKAQVEVAVPGGALDEDVSKIGLCASLSKTTKIVLAVFTLVLIGGGISAFLFYPRVPDVTVASTAGMTFDLDGDNNLLIAGSIKLDVTNENYVEFEVKSLDVDIIYPVTFGEDIVVRAFKEEGTRVKPRETLEVDINLNAKITALSSSALLAADCNDGDGIAKMNFQGTITIDHPLFSGDLDIDVQDEPIPCSF